MKDYDYHLPTSLAEAVALKAELGQRGRFVAGGTDVFILAKEGRFEFDALISLRRVAEIKTIVEEGDNILIGSGVTISDLYKSELVAKQLPVLADAAAVMGCTQMRNVATIGGNVMNAAASGDTLPPLLCLDTACRLVSAKGERLVPMTEMFLAPRKTAAEPDEALAGLVIPKPSAGGKKKSGAFIKLTRRAAMDLSIVSLAVQIQLDASLSKVEDARVAAGVVAPTPVRLPETERLLVGKPVEEAAVGEAASCAKGECTPRNSLRGSQWYREEMICVLLPRAVRQALARLGVDLDQAA